jgi:hypothetical protein
MRMTDGLASQSRRWTILSQLPFAGRCNPRVIVLALSLCGLAVSISLSVPAFAFQTFEHFYLGQVAYEQA